MSRKKYIKYLIYDFRSEGKSDIDRCIWQTEHVEMEGVKQYYSVTSYLLQLSKCARAILDFTVSRLDEHNRVANDTDFKTDFNDFLEGLNLSPYTSGTINKAFAELAAHGLVRHEKKRGTYQINPVFYFKGSENKRIKAVRRWLERPYNHKLVEVRRKNLQQLEAKKKDQS